MNRKEVLFKKTSWAYFSTLSSHFRLFYIVFIANIFFNLKSDVIFCVFDKRNLQRTSELLNAARLNQEEYTMHRYKHLIALNILLTGAILKFLRHAMRKRWLREFMHVDVSKIWIAFSPHVGGFTNSRRTIVCGGNPWSSTSTSLMKKAKRQRSYIAQQAAYCSCNDAVRHRQSRPTA